jgi:predicted nucleic acid-binding protein
VARPRSAGVTPRYLLDESAAFRTHVPEVRARLEPLMKRGLLARCGLTDLEAGVSARSSEDHRMLGIYRRDALEYLIAPDTVWERAWEVQEALTDKGLHRSVKMPDLIIAAIAEHHRVSVMHYDHDFDHIAAITGQAVEWVVPAGSI